MSDTDFKELHANGSFTGFYIGPGGALYRRHVVDKYAWMIPATILGGKRHFIKYIDGHTGVLVAMCGARYPEKPLGDLFTLLPKRGLQVRALCSDPDACQECAAEVLMLLKRKVRELFAC